MAYSNYQPMQMHGSGGGDDGGGFGEEEDLVRELLDNGSPFFLLPNDRANCHQEQPPPPQPRKVVPTVYSGPTLDDIEVALSTSFGSARRKDAAAEHQQHLRSPSSLVQLAKMLGGRKENKYTLTVKRSAAGASDDGYKWRKYGQKLIKNRSNPRSYYRCTNPRCNAKKQVERSAEDPDALIITYEGLHLHYAYPSVFAHQAPKHGSQVGQAKSNGSGQAEPVSQQVPDRGKSPSRPITSSLPMIRIDHSREKEEEEEEEEEEDMWRGLHEPSPGEMEATPIGMLEDILPSLIRNPLDNLATPLYTYSPFPIASSPSLSSSSSSSWSPMPFAFEIELPSNTIL